MACNMAASTVFAIMRVIDNQRGNKNVENYQQANLQRKVQVTV